MDYTTTPQESRMQQQQPVLYTPMLTLSKRSIVAVAAAPLLIFIATMTVCVLIVQARGNTLLMGGDQQWKLKDNVLDNDISAYGIDTPEHYIFAIGFTLQPIALMLLMYFRYVMWNAYYACIQQQKKQSYSSSASCCCSCFSCFNTFTLMVGWLHGPFLVIMGWSNGKYDQVLHFPAAMIGLGILEIYSILCVCVMAALLLVRMCATTTDYQTTIPSSMMSPLQLGCLWLDIVLMSSICLTVPFCVLQWLSTWQSKFEWVAVFLLLLSTLSALVNFKVMPELGKPNGGTDGLLVDSRNANEGPKQDDYYLEGNDNATAMTTSVY